MLRNLRLLNIRYTNKLPLIVQKQNFLTTDYECTESWKTQSKHPAITQINLNNFYNALDVNFSSKGVISAIDVDIFANAIDSSDHLDELRDLLHKLRLSAEAGNILESTQQATIRNYLQFGDIQDLVGILNDPLNFGVFLDDFTANILLNKLINTSNFEQAAKVASFVMLQEDYSNEITRALCQYACFKYILNYTKPPETEVIVDQKKKVEEIKIRIKFLRNPYNDDHFDLKDIYKLSGKTLAWITQTEKVDNIDINLQIIGWIAYKKLDIALQVCEASVTRDSFKTYKELLNCLEKEIISADDESKKILEKCLWKLNQVTVSESTLEESIKTKIENAINKNQTKDIQTQHQLFKSWSDIRQQKLKEQEARLDRAKRIEYISKRQDDLKHEEQKLWFFENEENIDLQIEDKEKLIENTSSKKKSTSKIDEDYIPPEILPKRR